MGVQKSEQKTEREAARSEDAQNEGEGSRSADRAYRQGLGEFMQTRDVEGEAERAKEAVEGSEQSELEQAEQKGKRGPGSN